ncbi:MAG TPA: PEGA domain-containing protein [Phycisphaerales bacterium]|nr:PEGA domain-containing protein [Phycisphaerales bacterium]
MLKRAGLLLLIVGFGLGAGGCLERRMTITSEPPGATATVNGVEVGRTPVSASFVYFGKYQVELERDGYEPLRTEAKATTPLYEYPPIDLLASAVPLNITSNVNWHFVMEPEKSARGSTEATDAALLERARELRKQVQ